MVNPLSFDHNHPDFPHFHHFTLRNLGSREIYGLVFWALDNAFPALSLCYLCEESGQKTQVEEGKSSSFGVLESGLALFLPDFGRDYVCGCDLLLVCRWPYRLSVKYL